MIADSGCDLSCMQNKVKEIKTPLVQAAKTAVKEMSELVISQIKSANKACEEPRRVNEDKKTFRKATRVAPDN
jgi:hypothetical protein